MAKPLLSIKVVPTRDGRYQVESQIDGRATVKRTVTESALGTFLGSLADFAITIDNSRPPKPTVESPFEESIHG